MTNPYLLLKRNGYTTRADFNEIIRWTGTHMAEYSDQNALLEAVAGRFGPAPRRRQMLPSPRPYQLWTAPALSLEPGAMTQLETALSLPDAIGGAGMPDMHPGYSMPIGGVVVLDHAISPAFVGYDISCMMMLTLFDVPEKLGPSALDQEEVRQRYLEWTMDSTSFGVGAQSLGADHEVMDDEHWKSIVYLRGMKDLAAGQLGSSGAGNHFADIVTGRYEDGSGEFVGLLTHSGSRGIGNKVGHFYSHLADETAEEHNDFPAGYGWFDLDSDKGQEYLQAMTLMGRYAQANHELIHARFAKTSGLEPVKMFSNKHNFAWVDEQGRVCHRKGATPAGVGQMGIIPGSSGSESFLVMGKGNPVSYNSASHGAGRPYSRTQAIKRFDRNTFTRHMAERGITYHGVAPDETVAAYKDIRQVMQAQSDLVDVVAVMQPRVVVMGGDLHSDDGD